MEEILKWVVGKVWVMESLSGNFDRGGEGDGMYVWKFYEDVVLYVIFKYFII